MILHATESDHQFHLKPTFVETFDSYDQNLWTQENGTFLCNFHNRMKNCVLTSGGNLGYITVDDGRMKNKRHMMTMWLLNNCDFDDCCIREKKCTHFTAGYIQSKQKFTYGVYVFVSRAIPHNVRDEKLRSDDAAGMSCFTLKREDNTIFQRQRFMEIGMCFSSRKPNSMVLVWKYDSHSWKRNIPLSFDASENVGVYGISWEPAKITWYVNDEVSAEVESENFIPHGEMTISIGVHPQSTDVGNAFGSVAMVVHMYKITYTKFKFDHTELFQHTGTYEDLKTVLALVVVVLVAFVVMAFLIWHSKFDELLNIPQGYDILFDEADSNFSEMRKPL